MQIGILLWIVLCAMVALVLVLYQYFYRRKRKNRSIIVLGILRFIAIFTLLLLIVNPKFTKDQITIEKSDLVVLLDNSSSVLATSGAEDLTKISKEISENESIKTQFNTHFYQFGDDIAELDTLNFGAKRTNISKTIESAGDIYANTNTAILLITDGNQTVGRNYEFYKNKSNISVFPLVVGDTTRYEDLQIDQINTNRYAFIKNKYPVEVLVSYRGSENVNSLFTISVNGKTIYQERLYLDGSVNSKVINALVDAGSVGIKTIEAKINALGNERNVANNVKSAVLEVLDEKTNIAFIGEILHPDAGALKKAIESNEQRAVRIVKPDVDPASLDDIDLFILYQPTRSFQNIYTYLKNRKANIFTITGSTTDWNFLNKIQSSFQKMAENQSEEISPILNPGFTLFDIGDFSIEDFPPLTGNLGDILITKESNILLNQRIRGVDINEPLFAFVDAKPAREAVLFGENIWKWRMQTYRNSKSFENFDNFLGKIIFYLSSTNSRSRLSIDYENSYDGGSEARITALYFDETFVFDGNANISVQVQGENNGKSREIPMLLKNGYYEADLSSLQAGRYNFTVLVKENNLMRSGNFAILDFDVEQQLLSSDYKKLEQLAENTGGKLYFPNQSTQFLEDIKKSRQFLPVQKSEQNIVSLIDFKWLLAIIVAALATEWFIRKYLGLI